MKTSSWIAITALAWAVLCTGFFLWLGFHWLPALIIGLAFFGIATNQWPKTWVGSKIVGSKSI
jgi:hypothetical protein